ncbi:MAG: hypothetical protein JXB49_33565 [Bacteroidales bacterium]|nr:hypothetical protein [Bacteroidales bacterium]
MKNISLFVFISLFIVSCIDHADRYYKIKDNLKQIADFNIGSYWIYYCDSLNINDTISIIDYNIRQTKEPFDSHYDYRDIVTITLKSSYWNCIIKDILEPNSDYRNNYERSFSENQVIGTIGFTIDFLGESALESQYGSIEYFTNYNFNGEILEQVILHKTQGGRHLSECEYYLAPEYGMIKSKIVTDSISTEWNLVNFNIIK